MNEQNSSVPFLKTNASRILYVLCQTAFPALSTLTFVNLWFQSDPQGL
jgi:hypothetical protein